jgi:DNA-binding MurR/RpiR family transcriptional regulator
MRRQIDYEVLDRAKSALLRTRHMLFADIGGGSSNVSEEAANRFFASASRLSLPATAISCKCGLRLSNRGTCCF